MPCEGCHIQFTVFKRKRSCYDCKRYYCHNCLVNSTNRKHVLCERCLLFSKRPLVRSDLIKLKPKDLIFYLQSKHISTAGCVEKEELIDLVLQYVNRTDNMNKEDFSGSSGSSSGSNSHHTTPQHHSESVDVSASIGGRSREPLESSSNGNSSFESIKQTCQNFFTSLSDNISGSLANLESRACSKSRPTANMNMTPNVTEQPRITTRVIPTYASSQQNSPENTNFSSIEGWRTSSCYTTENLVVDLPSSSQFQKETLLRSNKLEECKCLDEEDIITSFNGRTRSPKSECAAQNHSNREERDSVNGTDANSDVHIANSCAPSTSSNTSRHLSQNLKLEIYVNDEESSHSSFEELGAMGGISDDSKTTTDTNSNTTDQWQMLDLKINEVETAPSILNAHELQSHPEVNIDKSTFVQSADSSDNKEPKTKNNKDHTSHPPPTPTHVHPTPRAKKVVRRRSESYLNRRRPPTSADDDDEDVYHFLQGQQNRIEEECQTSMSGSTIKNPTQELCCARCGKNKANIRQHVEKMRQHLESSQMSEADIKQELSEFLVYLEQRTKSFEYSGSDAAVSATSISRYANETQPEIPTQRQLEEQLVNRSTESCSEGNEKVDGSCYSFYDKDARFINLDDIDSIKQLECLTVKQLKEILMLHRVDYKGCCEKQELLDRVERLWKNLKSTPAVEKLPTDELCKICMDAPIECVILECGHMATCTSCGKVLSECPICRQYIVRVVRFFRA